MANLTSYRVLTRRPGFEACHEFADEPSARKFAAAERRKIGGPVEVERMTWDGESLPQFEALS